MFIETPIKMKILLVEDENNWKKIFQEALKSSPNIHIVAIAKNGQEALHYLKNDSLAINLVIMDYELEDDSLWGVELAERILKQNPMMKMIFWSAHIKYMDVERARRAGAHGYVQKTVLDEDLISAIYKVTEGRWICLTRKPNPEPISFNKLTPTEEKVMEILADGKSYRQIASSFLESEYKKKIQEFGLDKVLEKYGNFKKYSESEPESQSTDQEENISSHSLPKLNPGWIEMFPLLDNGKRKKENNRLKSRLRARTHVIERHIDNIKKKLESEIVGINKLGVLIKTAIEQFSKLENKREISHEELSKQENLIILGKHLEERSTEQISKEHSFSESKVEEIIKEFKLEILEKYRKIMLMEQIAKEFGISESEVEEIIKELSS